MEGISTSGGATFTKPRQQVDLLNKIPGGILQRELVKLSPGDHNMFSQILLYEVLNGVYA